MAECSLNGLKTLCEKEKLLVTSNFSFSHSVFKRPVLQTRENQGLFGKGLTGFPPVPIMVQGPISQTSIDLTHYQTTNFRQFQTERVCRQQFQI